MRSKPGRHFETHTFNTHQDELLATHDPYHKTFQAHYLKAWNNITITISNFNKTQSMQIMLKKQK
jgi:hypothetical protein